MQIPVNFPAIKKVYGQLSALLTYLYPGQCTLCDAPGLKDIDICEGCLRDMPRNDSACSQCALPLPQGIQRPALCGACLRPEHKVAYDTAWAAYTYSGVMPWLITQLKFHSKLNHARLLGELMWLEQAQATTEQPAPDIIMPVPLHPRRLRERGFNQALELARPLARRSGIRLDTTSLLRSRDTRRQSDLSQAERRKNLVQAFRCGSGVAGLHVLLVDDVMTSGSTLHAAAQCLKKAGAERVSVWVAARATLHAT